MLLRRVVREGIISNLRLVPKMMRLSTLSGGPVCRSTCTALTATFESGFSIDEFMN